jgi:hypothetical protein
MLDFYRFASEGSDREKGRLPRDWTQHFLDTGVFREQLTGKTPRGRDTWVGTFLSGKTNRRVTITIPSAPATATLHKNVVRGDQKRYYFEIGPIPVTGMVDPTGRRG